MRTFCLSVAVLCALSAQAMAVEVSVKGVHLCCGSCVSGVEEALKDVEGVSDVAADQNTKAISFKAKDDKSVEKGLKALADGGFHGTATADKKAVNFPTVKVKKGEKANTITLTGLHLCCGACKTGVKEALSNVAAVDKLEIDQEAQTAVATGKDISIEDLIAALNKAGFHGELKKEEKK